jgi:hypothetical protein
MTPDRTELAPGFSISRILTGLWQVADQEKGGTDLPLGPAAARLADYAQAGFDTFDMADHYGSAELIAGEMLRNWQGSPTPLCFTKWCPEPGPMTPEIVRRGIDERCARLGVDRIDLLQFHWWSFQHPAWLDALHELAAQTSAPDRIQSCWPMARFAVVSCRTAGWASRGPPRPPTGVGQNTCASSTLPAAGTGFRAYCPPLPESRKDTACQSRMWRRAGCWNSPRFPA